jgi:hypothetical protein
LLGRPLFYVFPVWIVIDVYSVQEAEEKQQEGAKAEVAAVGITVVYLDKAPGSREAV